MPVSPVICVQRRASPRAEIPGALGHVHDPSYACRRALRGAGEDAAGSHQRGGAHHDACRGRRHEDGGQNRGLHNLVVAHLAHEPGGPQEARVGHGFAGEHRFPRQPQVVGAEPVRRLVQAAWNMTI